MWASVSLVTVTVFQRHGDIAVEEEVFVMLSVKPPEKGELYHQAVVSFLRYLNEEVINVYIFMCNGSFHVV